MSAAPHPAKPARGKTPRVKTTRARTPARRDAREVADLVRGAIDEGATTVEEIHKAIAALPLDVVGKLDGFEDALKDVRRIQEQSIGAIYDVIRRVNQEVTRLAGDLLAGAKPKRTRKPTKTR